MKLFQPSDFVIKEIIIPAILGSIFALGFLTATETEILLTFILANQTGLMIVGVSLVTVFFWTFLNYSKTLDKDEAQTGQSKEALKMNIRIWMVFWSLWAMYFSVITVMENTLTFKKYLVSMTITLLPGVFSAVMTEYLRWRTENEKRETSANISLSYISNHRKYWSGYYGLICIPIYTILTLIFIMIA